MERLDEHERFTRLLIQHEPDLLRCVLVVVPNRSDARDIMQECSVALLRRFASYDAERPFVGWALGFVRIEIRRFLRRSSQRARLTERAAELLIQDRQTHAVELGARQHHLKPCIERLNKDHRALLRAYYYEERSIAELSAISSRSIDAVYKLIQRIRQKLHECMELRARQNAAEGGGT